MVDSTDGDLALLASLPFAADPPESYTTVGPFPGAAYAPYADRSYEWNPGGVPLSLQSFPAPVFLLTPEMAKDAQERAVHNARVVSRGCKDMYRQDQQVSHYFLRVETPSCSSCLATCGSCKSWPGPLE